MNKYKKLIGLIEDNHFEIRSEKCHDSLSGWTGNELWIVDKENDSKIFDLSINGYCFNDESIQKAIEIIENYLSLKKMDTFDDFKNWVEKNAVTKKEE